MSLDDLDQALFEAKWGDAEEDVTEVIANMLELPRAAVERVLFLARTVEDDISTRLINAQPTLSIDLQKALRTNMQEGLARVLVRNAILNEKPMLAPVHKLIQDPYQVCSGCAYSIDCVAKNYSTPAECFRLGPPAGVRSSRGPGDPLPRLMRLRDGAALVEPIKIVKNTVTVTCAHPRGTFKIAAQDLSL
jgi:hypothetical protein